MTAVTRAHLDSVSPKCPATGLPASVDYDELHEESDTTPVARAGTPNVYRMATAVRVVYACGLCGASHYIAL